MILPVADFNIIITIALFWSMGRHSGVQTTIIAASFLFLLEKRNIKSAKNLVLNQLQNLTMPNIE
jgi:hypothetical protein